VRIVAQDNSDPTGAIVEPAEIFLAEGALLRKVVAGLGLRGGNAEDVLQTVSLKCLHYTGAFANRCQCRRWLIRVTTNECITEHRRVGRFRKHALGIVEHRSQTGPSGPVQSAVASEQLEAVREVLRDLDDEMLKPLVLKYFCDLSSAEIGETLEMPASTVRSLLRKGRLAMAQALMKRGIER
jgi:RNA polymerase sigma factor (sigma-70 family)